MAPRKSPSVETERARVDPNIRVLKVSPDDAELWDSPGTSIGTVKTPAAAATVPTSAKTAKWRCSGRSFTPGPNNV
jgi:hypothetical protein